MTASRSHRLCRRGLIRSDGGWQSIRKTRALHDTRIGDERILGKRRFVEHALKEDAWRLEAKSGLKRSGWTLEKLIQTMCQSYGIAPDQLTHEGRANARSTAQALMCYWDTTKLGVSSTKRSIGLSLSQPAMSQAAKRGLRYGLDHERELDIW